MWISQSRRRLPSGSPAAPCVVPVLPMVPSGSPARTDATKPYLLFVLLPWLHSRFQAQESPTNPVRFTGIEPAPTQSRVTWSEFLRSQAAVACDFATVDTVLLRRFHLLFFIEVGSRSVYFGGITEHPTGAWVTQAARNLFLHHADGLAGTRALVRDHGKRHSGVPDDSLKSQTARKRAGRDTLLVS